MKIFISLPMRGRPDEEIKKEMQHVMDTYFPNEELIDTVVWSGSRVKCLANSITLMTDADLVVFVPGWENAKGCRIEYQICKDYEIPYIILPEQASIYSNINPEDLNE